MTKFAAQERKFIVHAAHRRVGVARFAEMQEDDRRSVAPSIIDLYWQPSERVLCRRLIERLLAFDPEFDWLFRTRAVDRRQESNLLGKGNCVVIACGKEPFSRELLDRMRNSVRRGSALLAINAGAQTSPDWKEFAREMLGASFGGATSSSAKWNLRIAAGRHYHPVVREVSAWQCELKSVLTLDSRATPFLEGFLGEEKHPAAWGLESDGRGIFSTTLGTPEDFLEDSFFRLIRNALLWLLY